MGTVQEQIARARQLERARDHAAALEAFLGASDEAGPHLGDAGFWIGMAESARRAGERDRTVDAYDRAVSLLTDAGSPNSALAVAGRMADAAPDMAATHLRRGSIAIDLRYAPIARDAFLRALDANVANGDRAAALDGLQAAYRIFEESGRAGDAAALRDRIAEISPAHDPAAGGSTPPAPGPSDGHPSGHRPADAGDIDPGFDLDASSDDRAADDSASRGDEPLVADGFGGDTALDALSPGFDLDSDAPPAGTIAGQASSGVDDLPPIHGPRSDEEHATSDADVLGADDDAPGPLESPSRSDADPARPPDVDDSRRSAGSEMIDLDWDVPIHAADAPPAEAPRAGGDGPPQPASPGAEGADDFALDPGVLPPERDGMDAVSAGGAAADLVIDHPGERATGLDAPSDRPGAEGADTGGGDALDTPDTHPGDGGMAGLTDADPFADLDGPGSVTSDSPGDVDETADSAPLPELGAMDTDSPDDELVADADESPLPSYEELDLDGPPREASDRSTAETKGVDAAAADADVPSAAPDLPILADEPQSTAAPAAPAEPMAPTSPPAMGADAASEASDEAAVEAAHDRAPEPARPVGTEGEFIDLASLILGEDEDTGTRFQTSDAGDPSGDEDRDFAEILAIFRKQVSQKIHPKDSSSHYDLGIAYKEMGLLDDAITQLQLALRAGANPVAALEVIGECFIEKDECSLAQRVLERALQVQGATEADLVGVLYWLGRCAELLDDPASARAYYERVIAVDIAFRDASERLRNLGGGARR